MFLEAQFGADNVSPIAKPPPSTTTNISPVPNDSTDTTTTSDTPTLSTSQQSTEEFSAEEKAQLTHLHNLGIPVPGIEIRVDKVVAKVWLKDLRVECAQSAVLRDRVGRVVGRAVECLSGLV